MEEVFVARYGLGQLRNGLMRKGILEKIEESGYRDLNVYELSWVTGADIFSILEALEQLSRDLISVNVRYAVHWCYPLRGVAQWVN